MIKRLEPTDVSVIVPVYNGAESFKRCLAALTALVPAPGEIIIVDDGSSDDSSARARQADFQVLHTASARSGPASARNLAARRARGDILFFLDADVEVRRDAVTRVLQAFRDAPA